MTKPSSCIGCPLYNQPGPVWGSGSFDARIAYIGQNPGREEVDYPKYRPELFGPFVGASGRIRNRQFFEAGVSSTDVFTTNQVKCLTPDNRQPTDQEVKCCRPLIQLELERCKAHVVVLAGALAFKANIGDYSTLSPLYKPSDNIMTRMGCVEIKDGKAWIGTIHPAFVMRMPDFKQAAVQHLKKAAELAELGLPPLPQVVEHVSDNQVRELAQEAIRAGEFADDVETAQVILDVDEDDFVGADYEVTMCAISFEPYKAYVLDPDQIHLLQPLFSAEEVWKYEHNGSYDQYHIAKKVGAAYLRNRQFDTMLATHYLKSYAPKKLKPFCVSEYTYLPYYSRNKKDRLSAACGMRFYNGMDAIATLLVAREEKRLLAKWNLTDIFFEFGQPLLPLNEEIRRIGLNVDLQKAVLFKHVLETKIERASNLVSQMLGPMFNWNSPKQVSDLLYVQWKLPPQYNTKVVAGQRIQSLTTDYEARKRLRAWIEKSDALKAKHEQPLMFLQLSDYLAGETKKLEYLNRISPDGRIHPYYKAHGEETMRQSSKPSVQNWSSADISQWGGARRDDDIDDPTGLDKHELGSLRSMIIPDDPENDWLLSCDFSQMQIWIYAKQFNIKWLLDIFESGDYLYGAIYEKLYKEPFFQEGKPRQKQFKLPIPSQRLLRAKAVPLGFMFGRAGESVALEYGWPPTEGVKLRNWWFGLNPELEKSHSAIRYKLEQHGYIRECFGNIIWYPSGKVTEAINGHAQSPEAFIVIGSMLKINEELKRRNLKKEGARIVLSVHDSITSNIPDHLVEEVYEDIIKPVLERPIPQLGGFRFRHEAKIGKHWDWKDVLYDSWKSTHGQNRTGNTSAGRPEVRTDLTSVRQDYSVVENVSRE